VNIFTVSNQRDHFSHLFSLQWSIVYYKICGLKFRISTHRPVIMVWFWVVISRKFPDNKNTSIVSHRCILCNLSYMTTPTYRRHICLENVLKEQLALSTVWGRLKKTLGGGGADTYELDFFFFILYRLVRRKWNPTWRKGEDVKIAEGYFNRIPQMCSLRFIIHDYPYLSTPCLFRKFS